jgi:hypothetical protein
MMFTSQRISAQGNPTAAHIGKGKHRYKTKPGEEEWNSTLFAYGPCCGTPHLMNAACN